MKRFDLGNGERVEFSLTAKLGNGTLLCRLDQFIPRGDFTLYNTVWISGLTSNTRIKVVTPDGFPIIPFYEKEHIKGFSSLKEITVIIKENGPEKRIFHVDRNTEKENGKTIFKLKVWEEKIQQKRQNRQRNQKPTPPSELGLKPKKKNRQDPTKKRDVDPLERRKRIQAQNRRNSQPYQKTHVFKMGTPLGKYPFL